MLLSLRDGAEGLCFRLRGITQTRVRREVFALDSERKASRKAVMNRGIGARVAWVMEQTRSICLQSWAAAKGVYTHMAPQSICVDWKFCVFTRQTHALFTTSEPNCFIITAY